MNYSIKIKNSICRINRWVDTTTYSFLILLLIITISSLITYASTLTGGILLLLVQPFTLLVLGILRYLWVEDKIEFDFSIYNLPEVGEEVEITSYIKYWRAVMTTWSMIISTFGKKPLVGTKWKVIKYEKNKHELRIFIESLETQDVVISMSDFNFIGKITSKREKRNQLLDKIL